MAAKRIGIAFPASSSSTAFAEKALFDRLRELAWTEGGNVVVVQRFAEDNLERVAALVTEVLSHNVDLLVAAGTQGALTAKNATQTVPIVSDVRSCWHWLDR